jgi:hypothetical protein
MSDSDDFTAMNDPDFLAEYSRVRNTLETLTDRMRKLTEEFDRRARAMGISQLRITTLPRLLGIEVLPDEPHRGSARGTPAPV